VRHLRRQRIYRVALALASAREAARSATADAEPETVHPVVPFTDLDDLMAVDAAPGGHIRQGSRIGNDDLQFVPGRKPGHPGLGADDRHGAEQVAAVELLGHGHQPPMYHSAGTASGAMGGTLRAWTPPSVSSSSRSTRSALRPAE